MRFILKIFFFFSEEICIIFYVDLLQGHISIVRNLKDISTEKCTEDNCCGNKRHCLLCFKEKFKPTYLKKIQMHHYSHWNRRIHYKGNLQYIYTCIANIEGAVMNVIDAVCLTEKQQIPIVQTRNLLHSRRALEPLHHRCSFFSYCLFPP